MQMSTGMHMHYSNAKLSDDKTHFCVTKVRRYTFVEKKNQFYETKLDSVQPSWLLLNKVDFFAQKWILLHKSEFCWTTLKFVLKNCRCPTWRPIVLLSRHPMPTLTPINSSPPVSHICELGCELGHNWFRYWLVACSAPSQYLNQCWLIVNWIPVNKLQWNTNQNTKVFIRETAFENVVCEMAAILARGRWVFLGFTCLRRSH